MRVCLFRDMGQGQGRAVIFIIEHIKKTRIFLKKKKEKRK
jgi:hypothetical protein